MSTFRSVQSAVRPLGLTPDGITALVHETLERAVGGWSLGVQGALAEFAVAGGDPAAVRVRCSGRTVEALTTGGGLRLTISDDTRAFAVRPATEPDALATVYLLVSRRSLPPPSLGLSLTDTDPGALRPEDAGDLLADLAVGHAAARFCVRTGDAELGKRLRALAGAPWSEVVDRLGHELVAASPHRVVTTALGRLEVYSAIPTEDAASPEGPHTHLLPALLRTRRELAAGIELPADLAPGAAFHPPPGWAPPAP